MAILLFALNEVAHQLKHNGIESEILHVGVKPIRSCIACGQCRAKALQRCVFNDDICNSITEKMSESAAFIIGTPVYYGQPTGAPYPSFSDFSSLPVIFSKINLLRLLLFVEEAGLLRLFRL